MYEVRTAKGFTGPRRRRAGVEVLPQEPTYVTELTKEQLSAIKNDPLLEIRKLSNKEIEARNAPAEEVVEEPVVENAPEEVPAEVVEEVVEEPAPETEVEEAATEEPQDAPAVEADVTEKKGKKA